MGIDLNSFRKKTEKSALQWQPNKKIDSQKSFLDKEIHLFGNKPGDKKKARFYSNLHTLISSGLDIISSLDLIISGQKKQKEKQLVSDIRNEIVKGAALSEALKNKKVFSPYEYHTIKIGEESGQLIHVLNELQSYFNRRVTQKRKIINALSYPVIVIFTAILALYFMLTFLVPMFKEVFARFKGELPPITKFVISVSDALAGHFMLILGVLLILVISVIIVKKKNWFKALSSSLILHIPYFGDLTKKIYLERFCHNMALLIRSEIPLTESIKMIQKIILFYPFRQAFLAIEKKIYAGASLHEALEEFKIFDKQFISLIKVGEQVNKLDEIFTKLYNQITEEIEYRLNLLNTIMEPVLIIFVGIFVAFILLAMYLPMFQLSTSFF